LTRLNTQELRDQLRSWILDRNPATPIGLSLQEVALEDHPASFDKGVRLGLHSLPHKLFENFSFIPTAVHPKEGGGCKIVDLHEVPRFFVSKPFSPAGHQPSRMGVMKSKSAVRVFIDGSQGPVKTLAIKFSQNSVDHSHGRFDSASLDVFHGFVDSGPDGDPTQEEDLISTQSKSQQDGKVQFFQVHAAIVGQNPVELHLSTQNSVDQFRAERTVFPGKGYGDFGMQQVREITAIKMQPGQDAESSETCRRSGHDYFPKRIV
jgi:hypothetical protein